MIRVLFCALIATISLSTPLLATEVNQPKKLELDNEKNMENVWQNASGKIPGTLVVRVAKDSQEVTVAHVNTVLQEQPLDIDLKFVAVRSDGEEYSPLAELDKEKGQESWYFYWGFRGSYYYPSYWYGGYAYAYTPYYYYGYGAYNYYYYRPNYYYPYAYRRAYPCCWR